MHGRFTGPYCLLSLESQRINYWINTICTIYKYMCIYVCLWVNYTSHVWIYLTSIKPIYRFYKMNIGIYVGIYQRYQVTIKHDFHFLFLNTFSQCCLFELQIFWRCPTSCFGDCIIFSGRWTCSGQQLNWVWKLHPFGTSEWHRICVGGYASLTHYPQDSVQIAAAATIPC